MPDISIVAVVEIVIEGSMDEVAIVIEGSMAPDGMDICAKPLLARRLEAMMALTNILETIVRV